MVRPTIPIQRFKMFADGLDHPEGLAFDADGTLWAGGERGQIYRIDRRGRIQEVANLGGFCLGLTFSRKQELYVCNFKRHALIRVNRRGRVLDTWERAGSRRIETPNFSVFDSQGSLYFSDSGRWGKNDGRLYRLRPNGRIEDFAGPFDFANGLSLSRDERFLYVVESLRNDVIEVEIRPDGRAGPKRVYASGLGRVPDGAALDIEGNLYVTCYATHNIYKINRKGIVTLFAFDPDGTMISGPTNIAFGGTNFDQLFVANLGRWHICGASIGIKGQPLANLQ
jgi:gluconolactonase